MDVWKDVVMSGISVGFANVCTTPLDMIKVRMQTAAEKKTIVNTGLDIVRREGIRSFWRGIGPSIARGFFFGGARLGLYTPIKQFVSTSKDKPSFTEKLLAGSLSGGLSAGITSPIELLKTRMQSRTDNMGLMEIVRTIIKDHGIRGLWKGCVPSLLRSSLLTASQCAVYDESKRAITRHVQMEEGVKLHVLASLLSGLVTTTITNPLDVIKTRMFVGRSQTITSCISDVYHTHGLRGFMIGWNASYIRVGPQTMLIFVMAEFLRKVAGLQSL